MADLFEALRSPVFAVGVGTLGCRVAAAGVADNCEAVHCAWAAAHTDPVALIATGLEHKLRFELTESPFIQQAAARAVAEQQHEIEPLCHGRNIAVLFGSLGEPLTGPLLTALAESLRAAAYVVTIAADPLPLEGPAKLSAANAVAPALESASDLFIRLPAGQLTANLPEDCALGDMYAAVDRFVLALARTLIGAFNTTATGGAFKPVALKATLRGGGALLAGVGIGSGPNAAQHAADSAFEHVSALGGRISGAAAALLTTTELKRSDAEAIFARMQESAAQSVLGLTVEPSAENEALCVLLARTAGSSNVVSIHSAAATVLSGSAIH